MPKKSPDQGAAKRASSPKAPARSKAGKKKGPARRTSPPRPDELSDDTIEFLTALDHYKRARLRSFLQFEEIFPVLEGLGYSFEGDRAGMLEAFDTALDALREESGRLFPSWSEVFGAVRELGWGR